MAAEAEVEAETEAGAGAGWALLFVPPCSAEPFRSLLRIIRRKSSVLLLAESCKASCIEQKRILFVQIKGENRVVHIPNVSKKRKKSSAEAKGEEDRKGKRKIKRKKIAVLYDSVSFFKTQYLE